MGKVLLHADAKRHDTHMNADKNHFVASGWVRLLTNAEGFCPATIANKFGPFPWISKTEASLFHQRMASRQRQSHPFEQLPIPVPFGLARNACRLEQFRKAST